MENAKIVLAFYPSLTTCTSLATSATLAAFILLITGSNARVGTAVGVQGICNLASAVPAAALADRFGRVSVIRIALVLGSSALSLIVVAVIRESYWMIVGGLGLFGTFMGCHAGPVEAIFGDCLSHVSTNERSFWYSRKASLRVLGNMVGPLVSIVFFWRLGDEWTKPTLTVVLLCGASLFLVPLLLACSLREKGRPRRNSSTERRSASYSRVAKTIVCADLVSMLGSGMTVKYFPLFFWRDCHFSPIATNAIYCGGPAGIAIAAHMAQKLSKRIGRVKTTLLTKLVGISLLVALSLVRTPPVIVPLYLLRTWFMNCSSGLTRSILNENISHKNRAKWNAAESVNIFSWSGSAVLGGYIIEKKGYRFTFQITAALQLLSATVLASLLFFELDDDRSTAERQDEQTVENDLLYNALRDDEEMENPPLRQVEEEKQGVEEQETLFDTAKKNTTTTTTAGGHPRELQPTTRVKAPPQRRRNPFVDADDDDDPETVSTTGSSSYSEDDITTL